MKPKVPVSEEVETRRRINQEAAVITHEEYVKKAQCLRETKPKPSAKKCRVSVDIDSDDSHSHLPPLNSVLKMSVKTKSEPLSAKRRALVVNNESDDSLPSLPPPIRKPRLMAAVKKSVKDKAEPSSSKVRARKDFLSDLHTFICKSSADMDQQKTLLTNIQTRNLAPRLAKEDDLPCIYCCEPFSNSRPREKWLQCRLCGNWAHNECAGISPSLVDFICEFCKP
jgi:hypothetical protein